MRYKIDYDGLKKFLETLTYKSIKDGALIEAETRDDIDFFCKTFGDYTNGCFVIPDKFIKK